MCREPWVDRQQGWASGLRVQPQLGAARSPWHRAYPEDGAGLLDSAEAGPELCRARAHLLSPSLSPARGAPPTPLALEKVSREVGPAGQQRVALMALALPDFCGKCSNYSRSLRT